MSDSELDRRSETLGEGDGEGILGSLGLGEPELGKRFSCWTGTELVRITMDFIDINGQDRINQDDAGVSGGGDPGGVHGGGESGSRTPPQQRPFVT